MAKQYQGTKLQDLGNLEILDPTDKIVIVQPKDEGVMALSEFFFYVQSNLDLSNYYTTSQARNLFAEKANIYNKTEADARFAYLDRTYSKVQSDNNYAPKDDVYTKNQSDLRYAGLDFTYSKLELYTKDETFRTFALKTEIPILPDLSPYSTTVKGDARWAMKAETYTKIDSDARFAPLERSYDKTAADGRFAKVLTTYTKEETDAKFLDVDEGYTRTFIQNNIYFKPEVYTKLETENRYALKNNVYTIAAVNEQFAAKSWVYSRGEAETKFAPVATTYTKIETNTLVDGRVNPVANDLSTNYYTKVNADGKYATLALTYSRLESDAKYALISNTLTTTQLSVKYYDKTQIDATFAAIDWTPYLKKTDAAAIYATKALTLSKAAIETSYYTRAQVDDAIRAAEQGLTTDSDARYITAGFADERYALTTTVYNKLHTDATYATLDLTYSRIDSDNRYYLKAQVDTAVSDSATATLATAASLYLTKTTAASTYITSAEAIATLANKTTVYTKVESDARFHVKGSSYLKAEADARYLKVGLDTLSVIDTKATGEGAIINLNNTSATNLKSGRIVWNNETYALGNISIANTSSNEAQFSLDLRPNFINAAERVLTVTPTYIQHNVYGKLHEHFATLDLTYSRVLVDGMFNDLRGTHVSNAAAASTFATITNLGTLNTTVGTLSTRVTTDRTYLDTTFYKKVDVYNKTEADSRYYNKSSKELIIEVVGSGAYGNGLLLRSTGVISPPISFYTSNGLAGAIYAGLVGTSGSEHIFETKSTAGTLAITSKISYDGIWHRAYGDLHSYFAKAAETYTKTEADAKFASSANAVYTKAESDGRYPSKGEVTTLTGRVTTEEGKLTALTTNLSNNYHAKALVYTKTESDGRYVSSKSNVITLVPNAGDTDTLALHIAAPTGATTLGGIKWSRGSDIYTLNALIDADNKGKLQFGKVSGSSVLAYFVADDTGLWHTSYGDLHTYFAKSAEHYSKTEVNERYYTKTDANNLYYQKSVTYTRTGMDARYSQIINTYTKAESDSNFAPKALTYLKTESDGRYPLATDVYTKSESDGKYPLKADSYTKVESDARYYDTTQADARFALKAASYTKVETDGRYQLKTNSYTKSETDARYYDTTQADARFALKTDSYTKTVSDGRYEYVGIAYTKAQSDANYHNKTATYTRTEMDARYPLKADNYTKAESDAKYPLKTASYTKAESDARYYDTTQANARFEYVGVAYTKSQSDANYHNKTVTYTRTEMDSRYPLKADSYTKAESDGRYLYDKQPYYVFGTGTNANHVVISNYYTGFSETSYIAWKNSAGMFTAYIISSSSTTENALTFYTQTAAGPNVSGLPPSFRISSDKLWHSTYGDLHTYFAKSSDVYSKAAGDARYEYAGVAYTKAVSDGRYEYKGVAYTKGESDVRYYQKADVYTKTELAGIIRATDTRNTNQNPQWYVTNYPTQEVREFKTSTAIGVPGVDGYSGLTTNFTYVDASGGLPTQMVHSGNNQLFIRAGVSGTTWSSWLELESVTGAASKYYTKAQGDARYEYKNVAYTKAESDTRYYTKTQSDANYHNKIDTYTRIEMDARYTNVGTSVNFGNGVLAAAGLNSTNCDHIWHEDGNNNWHFCSNIPDKSRGNSTLVSGSIMVGKTSSVPEIAFATMYFENLNTPNGWSSSRPIPIIAGIDVAKILSVDVTIWNYDKWENHMGGWEIKNNDITLKYIKSGASKATFFITYIV